MLGCYRAGVTISEAVIFSTSKIENILTLKPSIVSFVKENRFPQSRAEVGVDSIFPCVFSRHRDFGVFASLLCPPVHCEVLFPKSKLNDRLYSALNNHNHVSVLGKVINVDLEQCKISASALGTDIPINSSQLLDAYFQDLDKIKAVWMVSSDQRLKSLANINFGDSAFGKLDKDFSAKDDLEFELPGGLKALVPAKHHAEKDFKKNDLIVGNVLFCDLASQVVYVTIRQDIIKEMAFMKDLPKVNTGKDKIKGLVLLNLGMFSVVMARHATERTIVFTSNIRSINDVLTPLHPPFPIDRKIQITLQAGTKDRIAAYYTEPSYWTVVSNKKKKRVAATPVDAEVSPIKKAKIDEPAAEAGTCVNEDGAEETVVKAKKAKKKKATPAKMGTDEPEIIEVDDTVGTTRAITGKRTAPVDKEDANATKKAKKDIPIIEDDDDITVVISTKKKGKKEAAAKKQKSTETEQVDQAVSNNDVPKHPRQPKIPIELPRLSVKVPFTWDDDDAVMIRPLQDSSDDSEDDESLKVTVAAKDRRERGREKLERQRLEEAKLTQIETSLNDPDRMPVSADDFDRMVLASPNSSILWLQYMAHHLENAEIDKARAVARKALKTISFREEQEKFNVWIGLLNLEHMYGTSDDYDALFKVTGLSESIFSLFPFLNIFPVVDRLRMKHFALIFPFCFCLFVIMMMTGGSTLQRTFQGVSSDGFEF